MIVQTRVVKFFGPPFIFHYRGICLGAFLGGFYFCFMLQRRGMYEVNSARNYYDTFNDLMHCYTKGYGCSLVRVHSAWPSYPQCPFFFPF